MNERQAVNEGLEFTGCTANGSDEKRIAYIKQRAKEIRDLGFRAVIVQSSKNEWGGGSKLLYADENYSKYQVLEECKERLLSYDKRREEVRKKCEELLEEIDLEEKENAEEIKKLEKELENIKKER